ncbi:restriction endonuclease subunit R [Candidatus Poribacteria bacterium]|nr:MAG: restriction endonuclease subunit R [Candidatus Poribacteria bacterium]
MSKVTIENPVINSPFEEPQRHFKFTSRGITEDIVEGRRQSEYFIPMPKPRKQPQADQTKLFPDPELREANVFINRVRAQVTAWRKSSYPGVTPTTKRLLEYWSNPENEPRLFFCQREAVETAIYLNECENKNLSDSFHKQLLNANNEANPDLYRVAFKMATGTGKTLVMAMLIVYHTLNKRANPRSERYTDAFLIVTPGVTIRDRLQVLLPENSENDYRKMNLLPHGDFDTLCQAKIVITNYHAFQTRKKEELSKVGAQVLGKESAKNFTETPDEMVTRVCRSLGRKKNIIVLNDEAHHCFHKKNNKESELTEDNPRLWISGIEAVKAKIGIKTVYDLSATPFFLSGSGYSTTTQSGKKLKEGVLFPWVVSDFALIDAIESGIAKVPRVPVADDTMASDPIYRKLWHVVGPKLTGINTEGEPQLPQELETALQSLYTNYEEAYDLWQKDPHGLTPPVMIVVCNNTKVSKLVYDWIAGWEKLTADGQKIIEKGNLHIFNNEENGKWCDQLNTLLIDSKQLESGEALSDTFKKAARTQIEQFRRKMNVEKVTDQDLLREVLNTVGKKDKLGEKIKCVVSVSMLSEGWDARRVTHILGVRAFSTQLLCEQVVGRGLRRSTYDFEKTTIKVNDNEIELETFPPEYAEVYGVPFSFIPATGSGKAVQPNPVTEVKALQERKAKCEITFPKIAGYRPCLPSEKLDANFTEDSHYELSTAEIPSRIEIEGITGITQEVELPYLSKFRQQETEFYLTKVLIDNHISDTDDDAKWWLFPELLRITRRWMKECVTYKDNTYPQFFHIGEIARKAAYRIHMGILSAGNQSENTDSENNDSEKTFFPIFVQSSRLKGRTGSTSDVLFETSRPTWETKPDKCHISHVVADTESWEQKTAQALEQMDEVIAYVKNHNLGFTIPYINHNGESRQYVPDFIVRIQTSESGSTDDILNLILEVSGMPREDKVQKINTIKNMWLPAVNSCGEFGKWDFLEITDPWNIQNSIRQFLKGNAS